MRYVTVQIPREMVETVEKLISKKPELGYRCADDFVADALSRHLERIQKFLKRGK